jgi:hypothetical protein
VRLLNSPPFPDCRPATKNWLAGDGATRPGAEYIRSGASAFP